MVIFLYFSGVETEPGDVFPIFEVKYEDEFDFNEEPMAIKEEL